MFNKSLVTIWSAPNYCYRCNNVASIMKVDDKLDYQFKIFEAAVTEHRTMATKKNIPEYFL